MLNWYISVNARVIAHVSLFQVVPPCLLAPTRRDMDVSSIPNLIPQRLPIMLPVVPKLLGLIAETTGGANDTALVARANAKETKAESPKPTPLIDGNEKILHMQNIFSVL